MNHKRWGEKKTVSIDSFLELSENGWFEIKEYFGDIEVFVANVELLKKDRPLLVCFSAAVPNRDSREYPFFSGLKISDDFECPLIALADPSLRLSKSLSLAWYLGNAGNVNLQRSIGDFVKKLSCSVGVPPVLIGGSGGGFAALATKVVEPDVDCNAVVWNPQVSVTDYYQSYVKRYMNACFPGFELESVGSQIEFFEDRKTVHDLSLHGSGFNGRAKYFQNKSDRMHLSKHCLKYVEGCFVSSIGKDEFDIFSRGNVEVIIGDWGKGHIPPPDKIIKSAILSFL